MTKRMYDHNTIRAGIGAISKMAEKVPLENRVAMHPLMRATQQQPEEEPVEMLEGHCLTCGTKHTFKVDGSDVMKNGAIRKYGVSAEGHKMSHLVSGKTNGS